MTTDMERLNRQHVAEQSAADFVALGIARSIARLGATTVPEAFDRLRPHSPHRDVFLKAAVGALPASETLPEVRQGARAYQEMVLRQEILGQVVGTRQVAMLTRVFPVSDGASAGFFVEGAPMRVSRTMFDAPILLTPSHIGTITIYTRESVQDGGASAVGVVTRDSTRAVSLATNEALLDGQAAVDGGRPASILSGLSPVGGGSPLSTEDDAIELLKAVRAGSAEHPYFVSSLSGALYLASLRESGQRTFPDVTGKGGSILGITLLIDPAAEDRLVCFDAATIFWADGGVELKPSAQTALEFDDEPSTGPQQQVSLFQSNTLALRAVRYISWQLGTTNGAAYADLPLGSPVV